MPKILVSPVNGTKPFTVDGEKLTYANGVYYLAGESWPEEIVTEISEGEVE